MTGSQLALQSGNPLQQQLALFLHHSKTETTTQWRNTAPDTVKEILDQLLYTVS